MNKTKSTFFGLLFFFVFFCSHAQVVQFQITYGSAGNDWGSSVPTSDGGYMLMMNHYNNSTFRDMGVVKIDSLGNIQWSKLFGNFNSDDEIVNVLEAHNGGYYVFGYLDLNTTPIAVGIRLDNTGNVLWVKKNFYGFKSVQIPGSKYANPGDGASIIKFDSVGNYLLFKSYNDFFGHLSYGQQTIDGGYVIAGSTMNYASGGPNDRDVIISKIDSMGNIQWTKVYGTPFNIEMTYSVAQAFDGGFAILANSYDPQVQGQITDFMIIKTDSMGNLMWVKKYGSTLIDRAFHINTALGGIGYVITGYTEGFEGPQQNGPRAFLSRIDINGNPMWTEMYGAFSNNSFSSDEAYYNYSLNDGGYYILGRTQSFGVGDYDMWCIKTNSLGLSGCNETPNNPNVFIPVLTTSTVNGVSTVPNYNNAVPYTITETNWQPAKTILCTNGPPVGFSSHTTNEFLIYPNPATTQITLQPQQPFKNAAVIIYNTLGAMAMQHQNIRGEKITIATNELPAGIYFITMLDEDKTYTSKLIIE